MRILFIHTDFRLYWPSRLNYLRKYLDRIGHELTVIEIAGRGSPYAFAGRESQYASWWECLFPDMSMEQISPVVSSRAIQSKFDCIQPDIIFSSSIAFPSGANAVVWARRNHKPVVIFDDVRVCDISRNYLSNAIKRRFHKNSNAIFIPAPSHKNDYLYWGYSEDQIFYGVDVVDNEFWSKFSDISHIDRECNNLNLPKQFFLGVGRQFTKKNWIQLLRAYQLYRIEVDPADAWGLVLVGNGPDRPILESFIQEEQVSGVILMDFLQPESLAQIYGLASLLVLPSLGETWGLVVNEAMSCGLPILVSELCGCASILVKQGHNGWMFDPKDLRQLKDYMKLFTELSNYERVKMGEVSRNIIKQWSLERFCAGVNQAIIFNQNTKSGFKTFFDRYLLPLWKGRYRPV